MSIRVMIVDDHALFRCGLKLLLEKKADMEVVAEAGTGQEAIKKLCSCTPDIVLLDINLPDKNGTVVAKEILQKKPDMKIIILTMLDDEYYLQELFNTGVQGFILKNSTGTDLVLAIRSVYGGRQYIDPAMTAYVVSKYIGKPSKKSSDTHSLLTKREEEICGLFAYGYTNSEVAKKLAISERTVETHRSNIFSKLNLKSRAELVRFAIENKLMNPQP
jgi:two-component system, NarL family, response regulator NreC